MDVKNPDSETADKQASTDEIIAQLKEENKRLTQNLKRITEEAKDKEVRMCGRRKSNLKLLEDTKYLLEANKMLREKLVSKEAELNLITEEVKDKEVRMSGLQNSNLKLLEDTKHLLEANKKLREKLVSKEAELNMSEVKFNILEERFQVATKNEGNAVIALTEDLKNISNENVLLKQEIEKRRNENAKMKTLNECLYTLCFPKEDRRVTVTSDESDM